MDVKAESELTFHLLFLIRPFTFKVLSRLRSVERQRRIRTRTRRDEENDYYNSGFGGWRLKAEVGLPFLDAAFRITEEGSP